MAETGRLEAEDRGEAHLADLCAGLASDVRVRLVTALSSSREGMVVGELLAEIGIPASTLSHHLDRLRENGWVSVHRHGTFLRYQVRAEAVAQLSEFLSGLRRRSKGRALRPKGSKKPAGSWRPDQNQDLQIEFD